MCTQAWPTILSSWDGEEGLVPTTVSPFAAISSRWLRGFPPLVPGFHCPRHGLQDHAWIHPRERGSKLCAGYLSFRGQHPGHINKYSLRKKKKIHRSRTMFCTSLLSLQVFLLFFFLAHERQVRNNYEYCTGTDTNQYRLPWWLRR